MRRHGRGGVARFRYSDLKEAARFAAVAVVMQIQMSELPDKCHLVRSKNLGTTWEQTHAEYRTKP